MFKDIKKQAYEESIELLIENSTPYGLMAAEVNTDTKKDLYINIFARDASISVFGLVSSGEEKLIKIAKNSLKTLAEHQSPLGLIPNSVAPDSEESFYWYLGNIDSNLWWLIALDFYDKYSGDKELKKELSKNIEKAINWLFYQDTNNDRLVEQTEASDWADYMPNNGQVLYTNVLWYRVLHLYGYEDERVLVKDAINNLFLPFEADKEKSIYLQQGYYRERMIERLKGLVDPTPNYLHYISYRYASDRCDVFANSLAIIFNVADKRKSTEVIKHIIDQGANKKYPIKILFPPIKKKDDDYRRYLDRAPSLNQPNNYHNGGIWPFIGAYWAIALDKAGQRDLAKRELKRLAELNKKNNWEFNEWFNSKNYRPQGMKRQSWNAAMYILAYNVINDKIKL